MATIKLSIDKTHSASRFDVVASSFNPNFIDHVGLNAISTDIKRGNMVDVMEMGPPFAVGQPSRSKDKEPLFGQIDPDCIASIEDLSQSEIMDLEAWMEDMRTRRSSKPFLQVSYWIHPPHDFIRDDVSMRVIGRKFSCAGFVLCCYEEAIGIRLLDFDSLPAIDHSVLQKIYDAHRMEGFTERRTKLGLEGDPPWKITLCGYILHSLNRPANETRTVPYKVNSDSEASFP